jgi:hypothetical protein
VYYLASQDQVDCECKYIEGSPSKVGGVALIFWEDLCINLCFLENCPRYPLFLESPTHAATSLYNFFTEKMLIDGQAFGVVVQQTWGAEDSGEKGRSSNSAKEDGCASSHSLPLADEERSQSQCTACK